MHIDSSSKQWYRWLLRLVTWTVSERAGRSWLQSMAQDIDISAVIAFEDYVNSVTSSLRSKDQSKGRRLRRSAFARVAKFVKQRKSKKHYLTTTTR